MIILELSIWAKLPLAGKVPFLVLFVNICSKGVTDCQPKVAASPSETFPSQEVITYRKSTSPIYETEKFVPKLFQKIFEYIQPFFRSSVNSQNRYSKYSIMVSNILLYISENLDRDIQLAEISKMYNLSPRYLNRIFKGVTGYPIMQYQQHLKVEKAKRLLSSSSLSILDIAMELNFGSSQYLSFIFKKVTGLSPGEYRKMRSHLL